MKLTCVGYPNDTVFVNSRGGLMPSDIRHKPPGYLFTLVYRLLPLQGRELEDELDDGILRDWGVIPIRWQPPVEMRENTCEGL